MKAIILFVILNALVFCESCSDSRCNYLEDRVDTLESQARDMQNVTQILLDNNSALLSSNSVYGKVLGCVVREANRAKSHREQVVALYRAALYFNAYDIFHQIKPFPDIFTDDAFGRIDELGFMFAKTFSEEYFSAGTAFPFDVCLRKTGNVTLCTAIFNLDGIMLKSFNNGTLFSYEWTFRYYGINGTLDRPNSGNWTINHDAALNITQIGFVRFDCNNRISRYHMHVPLMQRIADFTGQAPYNRDAMIQQICGVHEFRCTGASSQYANYTDCVNYLNGVKTGNPGELAADDSLLCRLYHVILTLRDIAHCPHLGRNSGPCQNFTDDQYYDALYNLDITEGQTDDSPCNQDWVQCQQLIQSLSA